MAIIGILQLVFAPACAGANSSSDASSLECGGNARVAGNQERESFSVLASRAEGVAFTRRRRGVAATW